MQPAQAARTFLPGPVERLTRSRPFTRSGLCTLVAYREKRPLPEVARALFLHDVVTRSAVDAASSATVTELTATVLSDYISTLAGQYAAPALMARSVVRFESDGVPGSKINVSCGTASSDKAKFILRGDPAPAHSFVFDGISLTPRKAASIVAVTAELFEHSIPNIEAALRILLSDSVGLMLDSIMFDGAAADETRPASILNGVTPSAASNSSARSDAMAADVATVAGSVAAVSGNNPIILIAGPKQAVALRMAPRMPFEVLASSALDGKLVAVASNALASLISPVPKFTATDQGTIHLNTAPLPLTSTGTPVIMNYPILGLFQHDMIALRTQIEIDWAVRSTEGIAFIESITAW
ncbi:hypothetical protein ACVJGC_005478 [Bradyrhizobium diazoefficiens]